MPLFRAARAVPMLLVLAGCGSETGSADGRQAEKPKDDGKTVECAVGGSASFKRACTVERVRQDGKLLLTVRHPDGGFRRFEVLTDGRGLATADGAEEAQAELVEGRLDVQVGQDRYRFPATVKGDARGE